MKNNNHPGTSFKQSRHLYKVVAGRKIPALLPADSAEVKEQYYLERINFLYDELEQLNFLEHPSAIASICGEINTTRKLLKDLRPGKNKQH